MSTTPTSTPITRSLADHPAANRPSRKEDCLTCRLTGFAAFTGIGAYAIYEARRQGTFAQKRPLGGSRVGGKVQAVIGFVFISLGIGRLIM